MEESLEAAVQSVRKSRLNVAELEERIDALTAQLSRLEIYQKLEEARSQLKEAKSIRDADENRLRNDAVAEYIASGNKKPYNGVEIRMFNVATVTNPKDAIVWVAENVTNPEKYLKFDERKFVSDVGFELSFVIRSEEPRAQLSSKL